MIKGRSMQVLIDEIDRNKELKKDYIVPSNRMWINRDMHLTIDYIDDFGITELGHRQISSKLQIPWTYYQRCLKDEKELLAENVNIWLEQSKKKRFVRTLDGKVRAVLSDRFFPFDHEHVAEAVIDVIAEAGATIKSAEITDTRMYIQCVVEENPALATEIEVGDVVQAGVVISNSEVGLGLVRVEPLVYRLSCTNGMITGDSLKRMHVGRNIHNGDEPREFFSRETIRADIHSFKLKVRDTVRAAFDIVHFQRAVDKMKEAAGQEITRSTADVVEDVTDLYKLSDYESDRLGDYLGAVEPKTKYGLSNSITRIANNTDDYERAIELERLGGEILDISAKNWRRLAIKLGE